MIKLGMYVALISVVTGLVYWGYQTAYTAGYNTAVLEQQTLAIDRQNAAIDKARADWEATRVVAEKEIIVEERIVEKVREVIKEIPVVVERMDETVPECTDLGPDFLGLFNAAIAASNSGEDSSPEAAPESNDALP